MALSMLLEKARAVGEAVLAGPKALIAWVRANPSRALAIVWMAGMAVFLWIGFRRGWKQHQIDVAKAEEAERRDAKHKRIGGPEVVEMMDVDEMEQQDRDRMHALGLEAAGDTEALTPEKQKQAQEARLAAATKVAVGERVGGDGDVVVVSKGGLAGWIKRNKGKKADPETLAWLRGEEAKEGGRAYAEWADGGNSLEDWIGRSKKRKAGANGRFDDGPRSSVLGPRPEPEGSGSGVSAAGSGEVPASDRGPRTEDRGPAPPASDRGPRTEDRGPAPKERFDAEDIGRAALVAIDPKRVGAKPIAVEPTQLDADTLQARMQVSSVLKPVKVQLRDKRLVIDVPGEGLFEGDELNAHGREVARQLAGVLDDKSQLLVVADDPARGMEMVGMMAIAGLDPERVSIVTKKDASDVVEIVEVR